MIYTFIQRVLHLLRTPTHTATHTFKPKENKEENYLEQNMQEGINSRCNNETKNTENAYNPLGGNFFREWCGR